jgi:hypothetical protein
LFSSARDSQKGVEDVVRVAAIGPASCRMHSWELATLSSGLCLLSPPLAVEDAWSVKDLWCREFPSRTAVTSVH